MLAAIALVLPIAGIGWAARCTTAVNTRAIQEYESYVRSAEEAMPARFAQGRLSTASADMRRRLLMDFEGGAPVRWNISQPEVNRRAAEWNGTVIDWVGAIHIRDSSLADLRAVLEDFDGYATIYKPLIYDCRARKIDAAGGTAYELTYGYQNVYRAATVFPQHYAFEVKARTEYRDAGSRAEPALMVHSRASEIRESDSGVPGRNDFLEPFHDHGILWALNTYWRARPEGRDLYVEFEAITLARSGEDFMCRIGIFPIPRYVVARVMDSLPGESLDVMLAGTKAECERRGARRARTESRDSQRASRE